MKLFLVLLHVSVALSIKGAFDCLRDCSGGVDTSCSYDRQCYFEAESNCELEVETCLRRIYRKPRFIKKKMGYCVETLSIKRSFNCIRDCSRGVGPSCSYDRQCYFEAENNCEFEVETCLRGKYKKPRFIKKKMGYCVESDYPTQATPCVPINGR